MTQFISTKAELARILDVAPGEIDNLFARLDRFYRTKAEPKRSGGYRTFYVPQGKLRQIQDKIKERVLRCAVFPEYLHRGEKEEVNLHQRQQARPQRRGLSPGCEGLFPEREA